MFYYDFLEMRAGRTAITLAEKQSHTSHLKSKHLKECLLALPENTRSFHIAIHLR